MRNISYFSSCEYFLWIFTVSQEVKKFNVTLRLHCSLFFGYLTINKRLRTIGGGLKGDREMFYIMFMTSDVLFFKIFNCFVSSCKPYTLFRTLHEISMFFTYRHSMSQQEKYVHIKMMIDNEVFVQLYF